MIAYVPQRNPPIRRAGLGRWAGQRCGTVTGAQEQLGGCIKFSSAGCWPGVQHFCRSGRAGQAERPTCAGKCGQAVDAGRWGITCKLTLPASPGNSSGWRRGASSQEDMAACTSSPADETWQDHRILTEGEGRRQARPHRGNGATARGVAPAKRNANWPWKAHLGSLAVPALVHGHVAAGGLRAWQQDVAAMHTYFTVCVIRRRKAWPGRLQAVPGPGLHRT